MPKSGVKPTKHDFRDYDYLKTKKLGGILPAFPAEYNVDAGIWAPNQEEVNYYFMPPVPAMPYGCTNYSQNELCMDEDGILQNPMDLENLTHANANGGSDLRSSLAATIKLRGKDHPAYFNIKAQGIIDWFDACRITMLSTANEKRGVSVGTPWYPDFNMDKAILPIPDFSLNRASWHNWVVKGWKTIDGQVYLIGKPWLGADYADKGFCYISRPLFNALMNIRGTAAYTLDKLLSNETAETVDTNVVQWIVSLIRNLLGYA
jgi:hypothetical protein